MEACESRVSNTQMLLTEGHDVMSAVGDIWRELYDMRPVDLPSFQAVLGRHVPRVPKEGAGSHPKVLHARATVRTGQR